MKDLELDKVQIDSKWISDRIHEAMKDKIQQQIQWSTTDFVTEQVKEFLEKKIVPEIAAALEAHKAEILAAVMDNCLKVGLTFGQEMAKIAVERLTKESYSRRKIFEELFK